VKCGIRQEFLLPAPFQLVSQAKIQRADSKNSDEQDWNDWYDQTCKKVFHFHHHCINYGTVLKFMQILRHDFLRLFMYLFMLDLIVLVHIDFSSNFLDKRKKEQRKSFFLDIRKILAYSIWIETPHSGGIQK